MLVARVDDFRFMPEERVKNSKPVDRLSYIQMRCSGKRVLDIGSLDETAYEIKRPSESLFGRICQVASFAIGVDDSEFVPLSGASIESGQILRGNAFELKKEDLPEVEIIVLGEVIEHVNDPIALLSYLRSEFPNAGIILTTPNATGILNVALAMMHRESMHKDHISIFSFKSIVTIAGRSDLLPAQIVPYYGHFAEARERYSGLRRYVIVALQKLFNLIEFMRPMFATGWIVDFRSQDGEVSPRDTSAIA